MGLAAGLSAVAGLTVYGNISATGTIYGTGVGPVLNTASGTGSQTAFTITGYTNTTPQNYLVTVDGLVQRPTTDYTVTANTINFTTAPPNGVQISILAYQTTIGATANNTTIQTQTEGGATSTVSTLNFDNGLSARTIGSTTQVRLPAASAGQVLTYDGSTSNWVASAAPGAALASFGQIIAYVDWTEAATTGIITINSSLNISSVTKVTPATSEKRTITFATPIVGAYITLVTYKGLDGDNYTTAFAAQAWPVNGNTCAVYHYGANASGGSARYCLTIIR